MNTQTDRLRYTVRDSTFKFSKQESHSIYKPRDNHWRVLLFCAQDAETEKRRSQP